MSPSFKKAVFFTKLFEKSLTKNCLVFQKRAFQTTPGKASHNISLIAHSGAVGLIQPALAHFQLA
ncbi:hypothetical protein [Komagataeibacter xylinus]|uniref:hypothetical protein n=1 Tax=Komagataeibacter xylinus TaxID=28448 RepID=UPI001013D698|nr:hypothetical protein [Komagataeibacter xylinus]